MSKLLIVFYHLMRLITAKFVSASGLYRSASVGRSPLAGDRACWRLPNGWTAARLFGHASELQMHLPNGELVAKQSTAFAAHLDAKHLVLSNRHSVLQTAQQTVDQDPLFVRKQISF